MTGTFGPAAHTRGAAFVSSWKFRIPCTPCDLSWAAQLIAFCASRLESHSTSCAPAALAAFSMPLRTSTTNGSWSDRLMYPILTFFAGALLFALAVAENASAAIRPRRDEQAQPA